MLVTWAKPTLNAILMSRIPNPLFVDDQRSSPTRSASTDRLYHSCNSTNRSDSTCRNALRPDKAPMTPTMPTYSTLQTNSLDRHPPGKPAPTLAVLPHRSLIGRNGFCLGIL